MDRTDPEHAFDYEVGFRVDKKKLGEIIDRCIQKYGFTVAAEVLDSIKAQGLQVLHHQRHDDLHRGHDRPGGEEEPHLRHGEEGHRHRKAVQARSSSPTTNATAWSSLSGKERPAKSPRL